MDNGGYKFGMIAGRDSCTLLEACELHVWHILAISYCSLWVGLGCCYAVIDDIVEGLVHETSRAALIAVVS